MEMNQTAIRSDRYVPTSWGKQKKVSYPYEYTTGTGQTCLIKKLGMEDILALGLVAKLDFFSSSVGNIGENGQPKEVEDTPESRKEFAMKLLNNFGAMRETVDKVLISGVIAPKLEPVPDDSLAPRINGVVYVDTVPFEDAMELFGEILDTDGVAAFRDEPQAGVGHVQDMQNMESSPL